MRTALKMLLATLGREEADELALVQALLEKLDQTLSNRARHRPRRRRRPGAAGRV